MSPTQNGEALFSRLEKQLKKATASNPVSSVDLYHGNGIAISPGQVRRLLQPLIRRKLVAVIKSKTKGSRRLPRLFYYWNPNKMDQSIPVRGASRVSTKPPAAMKAKRGMTVTVRKHTRSASSRSNGKVVPKVGNQLPPTDTQIDPETAIEVVRKGVVAVAGINRATGRFRIEFES